jgi:hypothetical protein
MVVDLAEALLESRKLGKEAYLLIASSRSKTDSGLVLSSSVKGVHVNPEYGMNNENNILLYMNITIDSYHKPYKHCLPCLSLSGGATRLLRIPSVR